MIGNITLRTANYDDAFYIGSHLSALDNEECYLTGGRVGWHACTFAYMNSVRCRVALEDDVPSVIWGVAPTYKPNVGQIWMLSIDITGKGMPFMRRIRKEFIDVTKDFKYVENYIMTEQILHMSLLKRLGFVFDYSDTFTKGNRNFVKFIWRNNRCVL